MSWRFQNAVFGHGKNVNGIPRRFINNNAGIHDLETLTRRTLTRVNVSSSPAPTNPGLGAAGSVLSRNLAAISLMSAGRAMEALEVQSGVVSEVISAVGSTADDLSDLGGALSDLAVIQAHIGRFDLAESNLKRALAQCQRSYKVNQHLQMALMSNLLQVYTVTNQRALSEKTYSVLMKNTGGATFAANESKHPWSVGAWSFLRRVQTHLTLAQSACHLFSPEEGLIHLNAAASAANNGLDPSHPALPSIRPLALSSVLVTLLHLNRASFLKNVGTPNPGKGSVGVAHIKRDELSLALPSMPLGLGAGIKDIEGALFGTTAGGAGLVPGVTSAAQQASYLGTPLFPVPIATPLLHCAVGLMLLDVGRLQQHQPMKGATSDDSRTAIE